ncbi:hypothetical protein AVEN_112909-1 [Araneus ventricosus]|uniref:Uncharacterized protein n=1 Tax=Araneus ventricosus TaxID=182803 RepID=A0A4Y2LVN6_ARAVE|nr:hypothetical protein AVEN_112909-1 [Araneus ventricosus]
MQYRKTPHYTTYLSPAMMFLGPDIRTRLDLLSRNETPLTRTTDSSVHKFDVGDKAAQGDISNTFGTMLRKERRFNYQVEVGNKIHRRHVD